MRRYTQLNAGWNAEPNAPAAEVSVAGDALLLRFDLNPWQFPAFAPGERATLRFRRCTRYRLGPPNDEGWYAGGHGLVAPPPWGEFYELHDVTRSVEPTDWHAGPAAAAGGAGAGRHFLFYLRDGTFECYAADWHLDLGEGRSAP